MMQIAGSPSVKKYFIEKKLDFSLKFFNKILLYIIG